MPTTPAEVKNTATVLNTARVSAEMSFADVHLAVVDRLGSYAPRAETLRTYHSDAEIPRKPDLTVLIALADVYGMTLSDLPYPAPKGLSDLLSRASRWNVELAGSAAA